MFSFQRIAVLHSTGAVRFRETAAGKRLRTSSGKIQRKKKIIKEMKENFFKN